MQTQSGTFIEVKTVVQKVGPFNIDYSMAVGDCALEFEHFYCRNREIVNVYHFLLMEHIFNESDSKTRVVESRRSFIIITIRQTTADLIDNGLFS